MTTTYRPRRRVLPQRRETAGAGSRRVGGRNPWLLVLVFALPGLLVYTVFLFLPIIQAAYYSL